MTEIHVPSGVSTVPYIRPNLIATPLLPYVGAIVQSDAQIADLPHEFGGRDKMPPGAVLIVASDGTQIIINGMGHATAAEIQDTAYFYLDRAREQAAKNGGQVFNFNERRERGGWARKEDFLSQMRDAFAERIARHKQNPRTDPAPVPQRWTKAELHALDEEIKRLQEIDHAS